ncbi:proline-rich protein 15-like protein A isoform X1 [Plectropomus leopardus]|uniref:proline-rich protein 15-like protein A isoform X1 n=1 Tax=Plectropomus leopardus TaxID=160734 RepID=UPI001C4C51E1|nr:proline-rich protein 15-like protein A isoform X1 [Plectropomus leopardus]
MMTDAIVTSPAVTPGFPPCLPLPVSLMFTPPPCLCALGVAFPHLAPDSSSTVVFNQLISKQYKSPGTSLTHRQIVSPDSMISSLCLHAISTSPSGPPHPAFAAPAGPKSSSSHQTCLPRPPLNCHIPPALFPSKSTLFITRMCSSLLLGPTKNTST